MDIASLLARPTNSEADWRRRLGHHKRRGASETQALTAEGGIARLRHRGAKPQRRMRPRFSEDDCSTTPPAHPIVIGCRAVASQNSVSYKYSARALDVPT